MVLDPSWGSKLLKYRKQPQPEQQEITSISTASD